MSGGLFVGLLTSTRCCLPINTTQSFEHGGNFSQHGECTSVIITLLGVYVEKSASVDGLLSRKVLELLVMIITVVISALGNTPHGWGVQYVLERGVE